MPGLRERKRQGLPAEVNESGVVIDFVSVARVGRNRNLVAEIPTERTWDERAGHGEAAPIRIIWFRGSEPTHSSLHHRMTSRPDFGMNLAENVIKKRGSEGNHTKRILSFLSAYCGAGKRRRGLEDF